MIIINKGHDKGRKKDERTSPRFGIELVSFCCGDCGVVVGSDI